MIQLIVSGRLPLNPLLKRHCLCDPDVLLELAQEASLAMCPVAELADRFSLILHDLRMAGAWKRTNRCRLKRTEAMLCAHISPRFRQDLVLLDVGASDGITTVEAARALRRVFDHNIQAYVADIHLWLLRYRRGPVVEYRASSGEPIMLRVGPFGVRLARSRRGSGETNTDPLACLYLRCERFRSQMMLDRSISLVNPLSRNEPGLMLLEFDCLRRDQSLVSRVSAVRASNVLNRGYFDQEQIHQAVGHLHAYLRDGGCLVISRNADEPTGETENGSVWIKEPDRFRWVEDFGSGSEVKAVVDEWRSG